MSETAANSSASGRCNFILGRGPDGTSGHVELVLTLRSAGGKPDVVWKAGEVPSELRRRIEHFAADYLCKYTASHPRLGFSVEIMRVGIDPVRRNEHERVTNLALRQAIESLGLRAPMMFAPPDNDPSTQPC